MDECKGDAHAAAAAAAAAAAHARPSSSSAAAAMFMSRLLPAQVELPECDICNEQLECSAAAGGGGGGAAEAKESHLPRLLPCGHSYCTRCIQMGLEANGGLLQCPERCVIDPPQQPASALKLPKNFALIKTIEAQADRDAMAELAALPCQQCDPAQPRQPAKVHCDDCGADYCKQHDERAHVVAQLASHRRISIAAHAAQISSAAATKKEAAFAAAAAASRRAAKEEQIKANKAMSDAHKAKEQLPKDLDSMEDVVKSTAKDLRDAADQLCSDFQDHRQTVSAATQLLIERAADLQSISRSAQQVQQASDFDSNWQFAQLQSDSQRVHALVEQAAQETGRIFDLGGASELRLSLSLSHANRHSQILNADLIVKLAPFLRGLTIKAQPELLYRATRDGFKCDDFVRCCANKSATLTLVKAAGNGFVFGAYTHCSWPAAKGVVADPTGQSFLFSLINANGKTERFSLRETARAIGLSSCVFFGAAKYDGDQVLGYPSLILMLHAAADQKGSNCANHLTQHHTPYQPDDAALLCDTTFFAGQQYFAAVEIEVFQL